MFPADTTLEGGLHLTPLGYSHAHQLAHTILVEHRKRIMFEDPLIDVHRQELGHVVATVAEGHLRQVVGTEREEVGFGGDLMCRESSTRDLDHGADLVLH